MKRVIKNNTEASSSDSLIIIAINPPVENKPVVDVKDDIVPARSSNKQRTTTSWHRWTQILTWISVAAMLTVGQLTLQPFLVLLVPPPCNNKQDDDSVSEILLSSLPPPPPHNNNTIAAENITTVSKVTIQSKHKLSDMSPAEIQVDFTVNNVTIQNKDELRRFSPPEKVVEQASLQIDVDNGDGGRREPLMIFVGGYVNNYNGASRSIQFFNISSQRWMPERRLEIPPGIADTHQGVAFDADTRLLYIVSGQIGGGCSPAVATVARIHIDTGDYEMLPSLPKPRYYPGVAIVTRTGSTTAGADPTEKHLHVFGGAAEIRNQTATDHWRLILSTNDDTRDNDNKHDAVASSWHELEAVPDAGTHGRAFVHNGVIYYTAFCDLDQGVYDKSENMQQCQQHALQNNGQLVHHPADAGFLFRYVTDFAPPGRARYAVDRQTTKTGGSRRNHWERLPDMPYPACHTASAVGMDRFVLFGGGMVAKQTRIGSTPKPLNMIQMFNFVTQSWETTAFRGEENMNTHNMAVWIDFKRRQMYGLRSEQTLLIGQISDSRPKDIGGDESSSPTQQQLDDGEFKTHKVNYLDTNRRVAVTQFVGCINSELSKLSVGGGNQSSPMMGMHSVYDSGYDSVRTTWNKRLSHLQYPDVVTFPESPEQVSMIVQCARKTGHHVCGRNGKHSFEGDTCTYGIVVDVAKMSSVEVLDKEKGNVRFGSGQHLGRVAVAMEEYGLVIPMGHCGTVGLTGLVLVGGQGILSRHLGMTSDYVSGIQLVDYHGHLIHATTTNEYADYVWLARGGGSAVQHFPGIIMSIEFSNLPKLDVDRSQQKVYTSFRVDFFNVTADRAEQLLLAWQDFYLNEANTNDPIFDRLTVEPWMWYVPNEKDPASCRKLYLACYFYGNDELHQQFLERFLPKLLSLLDGGKLSKIERWDDLTFHRKLAGVPTNDKLASGKHGWDLQEARRQGSMNRWKGYSAVASNRVAGKAFRDLAESIYYSLPLTRRYVEFKPLGGAVRNLEKSETAFWHRDAIWWALSSHWHWSTDSVEVVDAIHRNSRARHDDFVQNMGSNFAGYYAGYIDHGNSTGLDLELYYGENSERIAEIKKHRDPYNIFRLYLPNTLSNAPFNPKVVKI
jgi:FAD/FMN-containing dehydrogenase